MVHSPSIFPFPSWCTTTPSMFLCPSWCATIHVGMFPFPSWCTTTPSMFPFTSWCMHHLYPPSHHGAPPHHPLSSSHHGALTIYIPFPIMVHHHTIYVPLPIIVQHHTIHVPFYVMVYSPSKFPFPSWCGMSHTCMSPFHHGALLHHPCAPLHHCALTIYIPLPSWCTTTPSMYGLFFVLTDDTNIKKSNFLFISLFLKVNS